MQLGSTTSTGEQLQVTGTARVTQSAYLATASGAVGIGTTSINAGRNLQINGNSTDSFIQLVTTTSGTGGSDGLVLGVGNGTEGFILLYESSPLKFFTGGNERMRITSGGNVLIGTTTDSGQILQVNGNALIKPSTNGLEIQRTGTGSSNAAFWGVRVINAADSDAYIFGFSSSNYTTGGTLSWLGNSEAFIYFPTILKISQGTSTPPILTLNSSKNVGFGQTSFGTSATQTIAVGTGTAPTSSPADCFQLYSADITAGNAAAHFRTEGGDVVKIYQQTTAVGTAARVGGGGTNVTDTDTFGGYTLGQIVQALQNAGFLA
jgi:hypothetical protein